MAAADVVLRQGHASPNNVILRQAGGAPPPTVTGSVAGDVPALTGALTANEAHPSSVAGTVPALTGALTALVIVPVSGSVAGVLPGLTGALTVQVPSAVLAGPVLALPGDARAIVAQVYDAALCTSVQDSAAIVLRVLDTHGLQVLDVSAIVIRSEPMAGRYTPGNRVVLIGRFTDPITGQPRNPIEVSLVVTDPRGNTTTYQYGSGIVISQHDTGVYSASFLVTVVGDYTYEWRSTALGEESFQPGKFSVVLS